MHKYIALHNIGEIMKKIFKFLKNLFTPNDPYRNWEERRYLSKATDTADLERRLRELEYGVHFPNYLRRDW
jgi:uncharacterized protein DUF3563